MTSCLWFTECCDVYRDKDGSSGWSVLDKRGSFRGLLRNKKKKSLASYCMRNALVYCGRWITETNVIFVYVYFHRSCDSSAVPQWQIGWISQRTPRSFISLQWTLGRGHGVSWGTWCKVGKTPWTGTLRIWYQFSNDNPPTGILLAIKRKIQRRIF